MTGSDPTNTEATTFARRTVLKGMAAGVAGVAAVPVLAA